MSGLILVIEDEQDLVRTLSYNLNKEGYQVRTALTGEEGIAQTELAPTPDLILLDLMLPDMSGIDVCRHVRRTPSTCDIPIVMLTAKGEEIDRVVGFEVGADDYVVKPFSVRELLLRVKAILRRIQSEHSEHRDIRFGCLRIDTEAHRVWVNDEERRLTALEFRLLYTFLNRKGRVQTREVLLQDVWGINAEISTRTVDTHVKRLREKLGEAGVYIKTLRGVGYRFRTQPEGDDL